MLISGFSLCGVHVVSSLYLCCAVALVCYYRVFVLLLETLDFFFIRFIISLPMFN